jgi:hypothetical protein
MSSSTLNAWTDPATAICHGSTKMKVADDLQACDDQQ